MELDWSEQSPHIRTLFTPWQPGDGYEEEVIAAAEARCGVAVPRILRSFYRAWGHRRDLTQMNEVLLAPEEWIVRSDALIFCVENQACAYWALPLGSMEEADPSVVEADSGPEMSLWEVTTDLVWRTRRRHVSAFLDDLTYLHAFSGGALHSAHSRRLRPEPAQVEWLERSWQKAAVMSLQLSYSEAEYELGPPFGSPMYVRDGQALQWFDRFAAVANGTEVLDEIAEALGIDWEKRQ